jgi:hypothetical protein
MSDKMTDLFYALWLAQPVLQALIAILMFRRGQHRQFRFFFAYVVTQILAFALIFPIRHNYSVFFYLSWLSTAISVFLGFKVIHEAFLDVFRPFHTLRDLGTVLFRWAGLVMLLVAGVVSLSTNSAQTVPWVQAILTAQRCVRIMQVGMVLFLLFFAHYLGVTRRQQSFGIALGFGLFAVVELGVIASWVGQHLGTVSISLLGMAAYNCTLFIWLGYTLAKLATRHADTNLLRPQRWEQSLTDIQHPVPADSLIPMFEGMVDRALSRTQASPSIQPDAAAGAAPSPAATVAGLALHGFSARAGSKK